MTTRSRRLAGRWLAAGAAGRLRLSASPEPLVEEDLDALARDVVASGRLNWSGPATVTLVVSSGGEAMIPETAKACVDAAFGAPRPSFALELVDEDGTGWPAAWFAIEYAQRRAEWQGRGLGLVYRASSPPPPERVERLKARRVVLRGAFKADGSPAGLFPCERALVEVGPRAADPAAWTEALSRSGAWGVEWRRAAGTPPERFAAFAARALSRMLDAHDRSDLRDELAVALLRGRPWELPGLDLLETLAFAPDGRLFSSERGWRLAEAGHELFALAPGPRLRFEDLPAKPLVPALVAAVVNEGQPRCAACPYKAYCAIPPSAHFRDQGSLAGRLPDSPSCAQHLALLDAVFARLDDEKCLGALRKWDIDITRFSC